MDWTTILQKQNIKLQLPSVSRDDAILHVGQMLTKSGYVNHMYVSSMREREELVSSYIGHGISIPHGLSRDDNMVHKSGIVILQYPDGIAYDRHTCHLVIGISSTEEDHLSILQHIATVLSDEALTQRLWTTSDVNLVYDAFAFEVTV